MAKKKIYKDSQNLPASVADFIKLVVKKMRYRRKVRADVQAELVAHFEDELRDCKSDQEKQERAEQLISDFGNAKLLAVLMRRAKKRCRPLWKKVLVRGLQVLSVIFLYLLICSSPLIIGRSTISINYADWLTEFIRADRDEADNARPHYERAMELYVEMPDWLTASTAKWPTDFNDAQLQLLDSWLQDNKESLEALRMAAQHPCYWNRYQKSGEGRLTETLMPNVMDALPGYRRLAFAMRWQIRLQAYNGDVDSALRDCAILQRVGEHIQGQGLLIEQLVGVAIEALALGEISTVLQNVDVPADSLKMVREELAVQVEEHETIISLTGEKVFWYDEIQRTFTDNGKGDGRVLIRGLPYVATDDWKDSLFKLLTFSYPSRQETIAQINKYFEQADRLFGETPWDLRNESTVANEWSVNLEQTSFMLKMIGPAHERINQLAWRLKTHRIGLLTLLAIMRYQKDQGRYPDNLNELVSTGYLNNLPSDPFGDGPLVYKKTDDGFLLYSLGSNFEDDGGQPGLDSKGKPRMWSDDGDWVFWPMSDS
jgi:hypothetical protein